MIRALHVRGSEWMQRNELASCIKPLTKKGFIRNANAFFLPSLSSSPLSILMLVISDLLTCVLMPGI